MIEELEQNTLFIIKQRPSQSPQTMGAIINNRSTIMPNPIGALARVSNHYFIHFMDYCYVWSNFGITGATCLLHVSGTSNTTLEFRESDVLPCKTEVKQDKFFEYISQAKGYFRETYKSQNINSISPNPNSPWVSYRSKIKAYLVFSA